jgi:hypothetical protein
MSISVHINPVDLKSLGTWAAVIAGLSLFTWLILLADRRSARLNAALGTKKPERRCPRQDWDLVTGIARAGLAQIDAAMGLHARAAERIDAAEYALNRLLAECAAVMGLPDVPTPPRPVPVFARGRSRFAEQSLAA